MTDNIPRIIRMSRALYWVLSTAMLVLPLYYLIYWLGVNHWYHSWFMVNTQGELIVSQALFAWQKLLGLIVSLLVVIPGLYGLYFVRQLFSLYRTGSVFSVKHVHCLKHTGQALMAWVLLGVVYQTAKTLILSANNIGGHHILSITFTGNDVLFLIIAVMIRLFSWVMKEALVLAEENQLTI